MNRIGERTREQAAMICALSASNGKGQHITARWLGINSKAAKVLACEFYDAVVWETRYESNRHSWCELNAEAEAMLRSRSNG